MSCDSVSCWGGRKKMPTKTYFGLPKEKQQRLLDAAKEEFTRASIQEASIANIVKLAGIPRGSFYQYFEDKEDLYFYLFAELKRSSSQTLEKILKEADGDLFVAMEIYFSFFIQALFFGENAGFYKNFFVHMDYRSSNRLSPEMVEKREHIHRKHRKEHHLKNQVVIDLVDKSKLTISDNEEVKMLFRLLVSFMFATVNHAYKDKERGKEPDIEELKEEFSKKINWLKYGVYQSKTEKSEE